MSKPSPASKALVKATPEKPVMLKEFDGVRARVTTIQNLGRRAGHESILLGHELNRLKAQIGVQRGGDHTSSGAKSHIATLLPWKELVEQQTGLGYDACQRCMTLATAAKKQILILTAEDVLKNPLDTLPQARKTEVYKALEKAADGRSMSQLMVDFGAWKEPKKNLPPKATKESAAKRAANAADATLEMEQLQQISEEHMDYLENIIGAEAFKALDSERLAHFENLATRLLEALSAEQKTRKAPKK